MKNLKYFKMAEANGLRDQFWGWDKETADAKTLELVEINAISGIHTAVMHDDYDSIVRSDPDWQFGEPYFFMYHCLMMATLKFLHKDEN